MMENQQITDELKEHVKDSSVWVRLLFMLLFAALYWVAEILLIVVVVFQFVSVLFTGDKNEKVLKFGAQLSTYAYQVFRFLTYNSESRPFPLGDWPSDAELAESVETAQEKPVRKRRAPAKKRSSTAKSAEGKEAGKDAAKEEKSVDPD